MTPENTLVKVENQSLAKVERQVKVTNKIINRLYKNEMVEFVNNHFFYFEKFIFKWNNLPEFFLEKFKHQVNWDYVSRNVYLPLNEELIDKYKDYLNWEILIENPAIKFTESFLTKYTNLLDWKYLSSSEKIDFNKSLLIKFEHYWNWYFLQNNKKITWDIELIEYFISNIKINKFRSSNVKLTKQLILKYKYAWNWDFISENVLLDKQIINDFHDLLNWEKISRRHDILWTPHLLRISKDLIEWSLVYSEIEWDNELLLEFSEYLVW